MRAPGVLGAVVAIVLVAPASVDAARGDCKRAEALKQQGDAAAAAGDAGKALAAYEKAMDLDPGFVAAYEAAAPLWLAAKQYDVAVKRLQVVLKADPKYAMGWYNLAFAQRKKGENAAAVVGYQKFIELRPGEPDAYFGMGLAYKAMGELDKARTALTKYVELEKRADKQAFVDKARGELAALGAAAPAPAPAVPAPAPPEAKKPAAPEAPAPAPPEAKKPAAPARQAKQPPAPPPAVPVAPAPEPVAPPGAGTGAASSGSEKQGKGKKGSEAPAVEATPRTRAEASKLAGDARRDSGDPAGAERSYRAAIQTDPSWAPPHNELGTLLFEQGKTEEAVAAFERAVGLDARLELGWYNLAHARRKLGRHPQAVEAYRKYIELAPGKPDPYYGLGESLLALGDRAGARAAFARYLELEKRPSQQKWVDQARLELGKLDGAPATATTPPAGPPAPPPAGPPAPTPPPPTLPAPAPTPPAPTPTPPGAPAAPSRTPGVITPMPAPTPAQLGEARRWREKGDAAFAAHRYDEAAADYRGAIAADPSGADARYRLGVTLAARGELAGAIAAWEGVLLVDAGHEKARRNIELARRKQKAPERQPAADDATALTRARTLVDDGRWASALALLDALLADARFAQDASALSLRAEARLGGGDAAGAVVDWLGVLALDPRVIRAYRGLADAYAVLGDTARSQYFRDLAGTVLPN